MEIVVRKGFETDGRGAINVLHRSISELCVVDHGGDARDIAEWISNKTEATWGAWVKRKDASVFVAEKADEIVAVGMIDGQGQILLNYVRPDVRFSGISKAVLKVLEDTARQTGMKRCFLESTKTARQFYIRCGYEPIDTSLSLEKRF